MSRRRFECWGHTENRLRLCVLLQARVQQLSKAQPLMEEMQTKLRSLEDTKGWLERRLKETEVCLFVSLLNV